MTNPTPTSTPTLLHLSHDAYIGTAGIEDITFKNGSFSEECYGHSNIPWKSWCRTESAIKSFFNTLIPLLNNTIRYTSLHSMHKNRKRDSKHFLRKHKLLDLDRFESNIRIERYSNNCNMMYLLLLLLLCRWSIRVLWAILTTQ